MHSAIASRCALSFLLCLLTTGAAAQSAVSGAGSRAAHVGPQVRRAPAPRGLYCSCPPTHATSNSVMASVAQQPFVEGILVRVGWRDVEPSRGAYDFSLIAKQLDLAELYGKRVALAIVQGPSTPAWLGAEGAALVGFDFQGQPVTIAAAWDPVYQSIWSDTIAALGATFAFDPRIALLHVTNASANGFEMHLPLNAQAAFTAAGYTEQGYVDSWTRSIDAYAAAFPAHPLDVEIHPVYGSDAVAQAVTAYGESLLGPGYGAFAGWWSVDNAAQAYPGMYTLIAAAAAADFATLQLVGSWVVTPERFDFDLQEYMQAFTLAQAVGVRYLEVWNADLLDAGLQPFLSSINDALTQ